MKKFIIILVVFLSFHLFSNKEYDLTSDAIRFRVIANSNSTRDILMKEKVVKELSSTLFKDLNKEKTKENILNNISNIEDKIDTLFNNNNYDKTYNIIYGMNEFPKKEYKGKIYDEGKYESLVIEIGEAAGDNYWCFLYPSLCMIDDIEEENNIIYESKIYNFLKDLFM